MRSVCGSRSLLCAECYGRTPRQHKLSPARAQPRHGELLIAVGDPVAVEASFALAIGVARRQNAKLRERIAWAQFLPLGPAFRVTACQETRGFFRREETLGRRLPLTGGLPWLLRFCGGKSNRLASRRNPFALATGQPRPNPGNLTMDIVVMPRQGTRKMWGNTTVTVAAGPAGAPRRHERDHRPRRHVLPILCSASRRPSRRSVRPPTTSLSSCARWHRKRHRVRDRGCQ
jgi:hypothetical protein